MQIDITALRGLDGFIGACVVDSESGVMLASEGGSEDFDLEAASAANTTVVRSKDSVLSSLNIFHDGVEDILLSLRSQYHLIRPLGADPALYVYVALERRKANLDLARRQVKAVESAISA